MHRLQNMYVLKVYAQNHARISTLEGKRIQNPIQCWNETRMPMRFSETLSKRRQIFTTLAESDFRCKKGIVEKESRDRNVWRTGGKLLKYWVWKT